MHFDQTDEEYMASTIKVLASVLPVSADEIYKQGIAEAHKLALLPNDQKCIFALLEHYGFVRQGCRLEGMGIKKSFPMIEQCPVGTTILVQFKYDKRRFHVIKVIENKNLLKEKIQAFQPNPHMDSWIQTIWVKCPTGIEYNMVKRNKRNCVRKTKAKEIPQETDTFCYYQPNPKENFIGDCEVRAVAGVLGVTWDDALDMMAVYGYPTINHVKVLGDFIEDTDFYGQDSCVMGENEDLSGEMFCERLNKIYTDGERILAMIGFKGDYHPRKLAHIVAILPTRQKDGHILYKFHDTWDSSKHIVTAFLVMEETARKEHLKEWFHKTGKQI